VPAAFDSAMRAISSIALDDPRPPRLLVGEPRISCHGAGDHGVGPRRGDLVERPSGRVHDVAPFARRLVRGRPCAMTSAEPLLMSCRASNLLGEDARVFRELLTSSATNREAAPVLSRPRRLDRRVQREEVRLAARCC